MKTTMTLGEIRAQRPCADGWRTLVDALGTTAPETAVDLRQILSSNGPRDAWWATRCLPRRERVALGVVAAETVAHIATDPRISACLETCRRWVRGEATDEELREAASEAEAEAEAARAAAEAEAAEAWAVGASAAAEARAAEARAAAEAAEAEARAAAEAAEAAAAAAAAEAEAAEAAAAAAAAEAAEAAATAAAAAASEAEEAAEAWAAAGAAARAAMAAAAAHWALLGDRLRQWCDEQCEVAEIR